MNNNTSPELNIKALSAALALLALAIFLYLFWGGEASPDNDKKQAASMAASTSVSFEAGAAPKCFSDAEGFYFFMSDGVKRYDSYGKTMWDYPLSFSAPAFVGNGEYAGAGEYKGSNYYAFGTKGLLYSVNADVNSSGTVNAIVNFSIGANGYSAVTVSTSSGGYNISVYNAEGVLITHFVAEDKNNYPTCTAISPDGRILAVSYLNVSKAKMQSYICAYYINSSEGIDFQDSMFASFQSTDNEIISKVKFIDESRLMFMSDGQLGVYQATTSNQMKLLWQEPLNNEVLFADSINGKGVVIALGKSIVNKDGLAEGTLLIYSADGAKLSEYNENGHITYLSCGKDSVIIGSGNLGRKFTSISFKGRVVWEYTATGDVYEFIPLNKQERALLVMPGTMEIMEKSSSVNRGSSLLQPAAATE